MTSSRFNKRQREAQTEMEILDRLPIAVRAAIHSADKSVRASVVRDALLRGVSEETIIAMIKRSQKS